MDAAKCGTGVVWVWSRNRRRYRQLSRGPRDQEAFQVDWGGESGQIWAGTSRLAGVDPQCLHIGKEVSLVKETALFVGCGRTFPGRERPAIETYHAWIEVLEDLKTKGEIEDFKTFLLDPHGGELDGFTLVFADQEKLFELLVREDLAVLCRRAMAEYAKFSIIPAITGDLVEREYKLLEEEVLPVYERVPVSV